MDEELAELPPLARLLFIGLWCLADVAGRVEDRQKRIKAEVLPYDDVDIDPLLTLLHEAGFIVRYTSNERRCIQVVQFCRHQRITGKEAESESLIPEYDPSNVREALGKQRGNTGETVEIAGREGKGRERKVVPSNDVREMFGRFWKEWPKKVAKEDAWKAFKKPGCYEALESILSAIQKHRESDEWKKQDGKFIPHPATWLNGKRWQDEGFAPVAQAAFVPPAPEPGELDFQEQVRLKWQQDAIERGEVPA
jgi:hypothetical protein